MIGEASCRCTPSMRHVDVKFIVYIYIFFEWDSIVRIILTTSEAREAYYEQSRIHMEVRIEQIVYSSTQA